MEVYSSSVDMLPVAVGGLAGHIFPPGNGRFVGGCTGFVRLDEAGHRHVGGCVGRIVQVELGPFLGGCVGFARPGIYHAERRGRPHGRHHEALAKWGEEALEAAPAR